METHYFTNDNFYHVKEFVNLIIIFPCMLHDESDKRIPYHI